MELNEIIGKKIVELFKLQPSFSSGRKAQVRYDTSWGDKTLEGIGACVERIMEESDPQTLEKIKEAVCELKNSELYELKAHIEKEISLSEACIEDGEEKRR